MEQIAINTVNGVARNDIGALPVTDETRGEQRPVGTTDGGEVFRCLRASYYKVGLYNIIVKGYPGVLVPVKKD